MRTLVVCPAPLDRCETFVQAHVRGLPGVVGIAHGGRVRVDDLDGRRLYDGNSIANRVIWRLARLDQSRRFAHQYRQVLRRLRPEVVLAQFGPSGVACLEACLSRETPLVVNFRGADIYAEEFLSRYGEQYRRVFDGAAAIIGVSRAMCQRLIEMGAPSDRVHWNPSGVNVGMFQPGNPGHNAPEFLFVGRFVEKKAPDLTIQAFRAVVDECPEARLTMIGNGPLQDRCEKLVRELELGSHVHMPGALPHADVSYRMRTARCYVQHSRQAPDGDCEGTPVAIQEAAASGLPIVATRHAGIPDVVIEEQSGLLVDEGDVIGMGHQMLRLAKDPGLCDEFGREGRRFAEEVFALDKRISRLNEILAAAAGRAPASALNAESTRMSAAAAC